MKLCAFRASNARGSAKMLIGESCVETSNKSNRLDHSGCAAKDLIAAMAASKAFALRGRNHSRYARSGPLSEILRGRGNFFPLADDCQFIARCFDDLLVGRAPVHNLRERLAKHGDAKFKI